MWLEPESITRAAMRNILILVNWNYENVIKINKKRDNFSRTRYNSELHKNANMQLGVTVRS